ncbi:MAG TPA: ATP-dependent zinc metalloprotease FtsH [Polyangia bacterium]|jgi:cell division protease FtsH
MKKPNRGTLVFMALVALGIALMVPQRFWWSEPGRTTISYSEFQRLLRDEKVKEVVVSATEIRGELKEPDAAKGRYFKANRVEPELAKDLARSGIAFAGKVDSSLLPALLSWGLPIVVLVGVWLFLQRRMAARGGPGAGLLAVGKNKSKVFVETDTKATFRDVAGVDEAKDELKEVVAFLRDPKAYGRLGARMPKGVLLVGAPGTGKTLLARAVAGEAGVPFFSISGSEFVEMFVGVGAARVRDLFEQARGQAPCIIFIDELDALGRARAAYPMMGGGHDEKEQTLNQLLVELDGFDPSSGIVLLAATNRPEILDPALLRAGRFDRQVLVDRPDKKGRAAILAVHMVKVTVDGDVHPDEVAALTPGFTGADLANLVNEAALAATRRDAAAVGLADFHVALERIVAGLEKKNRLLSVRERRVVAYHEMGHALVATALPGTDPVRKVSIIPRGIAALGYTIQRPTEDRYLMTQPELESKMAALLGGRAAEQLVFEQLSTGAADDLGKVTEIARSMVTHYAMDPKLGHVTYGSEPSPFLGPSPATFQRRGYSEVTAQKIDRAVEQMAERAYQQAAAVLERHRRALEAGASELLVKESLDEADLKRLFADIAAPADAGAAAMRSPS